MGKKSRLWCFTNFDLEFDYGKYLDDTSAVYIVYGSEQCPSTGRVHHQGWVYFSEARGSVKQVAKQLGGAHVEMAKGSIDQKFCAVRLF